MAINLTAAEIVAALGKGSSELKFLLSREEIEEELQAKFFHVGITTLPKFATIAEGDAEMKTILRDNFGLDGTVDIASRVKVASVLVAFHTAQSRSEKMAEFEGEMSSKRLLKPLTTSEYQSMRQAWENKYWPLEDSQTPGRVYVEKRANDIESGDIRAEPLTTILSRDEDQVESFVSFWDSSGQLQLKKGGSAVAEPTNPEGLRKRIKLMGVCLMMLALRNSNRPDLQGCTPQDFEDLLSYLLGEHVWMLAGKSSEGYTVLSPSWSQLLIYEYAIRRRAYSRIESDGIPFRDALKESYKDSVTKERYFTTPLALASVNKRPLAFNDNDFQQRSAKTAKNKGDKGGKGGNKGDKGGKGGGKGKGKGKGKNKGKSKHNYCYAYNNSWERCRNKNCAFDHLCMKCGGRHPVYQCTNGEAAAETQGNQSNAE